MHHIFYFHGFAGSEHSKKIQWLKEKFGPNNITAPTLPVNPDILESTIVQQIQAHQGQPIVFAGISLGGWWATYFSQKYQAPCIIVNPASNPSNALMRYLNQPVLRRDCSDIITVAPEDIEGYGQRELWLKECPFNGALVNLFLAEDDTVIDYKETLAAFPEVSMLALFPNGEHSFEAHWPFVMKRLEKLVQ